MKYGIWNRNAPDPGGVNALVQAGYSPLMAMVLSARGISGPRQAREYLLRESALPDPFLLRDMDRAVRRVQQAIDNRERIVVFGDYDVDGITATCLLTDYLRSRGCDCRYYIPGRLEEGYGLNPIAIHTLAEQGAGLIITVDCGITATEEALLCRELGMELVITDHHECKDTLPAACAVVDPHRPDDTYPHKTLSGVGVAFKLASGLEGSQEAVLARYADLVCLGTVADVMLLRGENRVFVNRGLETLRTAPRPGLEALMEQCGCNQQSVNASSIGYMLAPRINAAGRMGNITPAVELFLTDDSDQAQEFAKTLCALNRQRQAVESKIYQQAVAMLPASGQPEAIVLADERWHQGVVGIVASRIAEEYCCPTFLICMDGEHGKASSRSFGGFNLFSALTTLSPLLESYGGHELAAGFTISRDKLDAFRTGVCAMSREYYASHSQRTQLQADCAVPPEMLTRAGIESLDALEPCGSGCPKPVLVLENAVIDRITPVGNAKHIRLRLRCGRQTLGAIFFFTTAQEASIEPGDAVDVAFVPQINEYRGERTPQLNVLDIRPACAAPCPADTSGYAALRGGTITPETAAALLPSRAVLAAVWKSLAAFPGDTIEEGPVCLCRKIVRRCGIPLSLGQMLICLDIFQEVGLLTMRSQRKTISIRLTPGPGKADLNQAQTMQALLHAKERGYHGNL